MIVWQSIEQLDKIVQDILKCIPKENYKIHNQIESSNDSIGSNFVEGYYASSLGEYIKFIKYSRRSAAEIELRVARVHSRNYIGDNLYEKFKARSAKTNYSIDQTRRSLEKKRNYNKK